MLVVFLGSILSMRRIFVLAFFCLIALSLKAQEKPEGLFINSKAPDFTAKDQQGNPVRLKEILKNGPVVLVFYRGYWCPYCNKYLRKLEDSLQLIKEKGAQLIAVTPERPENIAKTVEKTKAGYTIVFDENMKIMKGYEVAYEVDEKTIARYKRADIDLGAVNGQKNAVFLPIPAIYIISREGTVVYRFFDTDYKKRATVKEILENL